MGEYSSLADVAGIDIDWTRHQPVNVLGLGQFHQCVYASRPQWNYLMSWNFFFAVVHIAVNCAHIYKQKLLNVVFTVMYFLKIQYQFAHFIVRAYSHSEPICEPNLRLIWYISSYTQQTIDKQTSLIPSVNDGRNHRWNNWRWCWWSDAMTMPPLVMVALHQP